MDKKSYDLVLKLTENSNDALSLFYRLSALLAVGQSEQALNLIYTKRIILQERLAILIKIHIEILCLLKRFDDAYNELKYYEELPYESQEVEELLRAMPDYIKKEEMNRGQRRIMDEEEIQKRLMSKDDEEVLSALDEIKNLRVEPYLLPILKIMRSYPRQVVRSFALLLLVNQKYDKEVDFLRDDKLIKVVPSSLEEPFSIPGFDSLQAFSFALQSMYHDPSIANNAMNIVSSYIIYIYPNSINYSPNESLIIFGYLAKRMLQIEEDDLKEVCLSKKIDYAKVIREIDEIDRVLKNF
ncbi:MAG: hypothetical protein J6X50_03090 [Bacilli bacterium]|nr:hypothetical protein [Bacilli bacterium]